MCLSGLVDATVVVFPRCVHDIVEVHATEPFAGVYNSEEEANKVTAAAQAQLDEASQPSRPKHPRKAYRGFHGVVFDRDAKTFEAILELPHRGTEVSGGEYSSPEAAARAYDALVRMYASESVSSQDDIAMWGQDEPNHAAEAEAQDSIFSPPLNFPQAGVVPPSLAPAQESHAASTVPGAPAAPAALASVSAVSAVGSMAATSQSQELTEDEIEPSATATDISSSWVPPSASSGEFSWLPPSQQRPHERRSDPIPVREGQRLSPEEVVLALRDEGGVDVRVIDVSKKTSLAEHLIFVTGRTPSHMRRLADMVCRALRRRKLREWDSVGRWEVENRNGDDWMAVDCGSMVVNVFEAGARAALDVEGIWSQDLPDRVDVADVDAQIERNVQALATGALMPEVEGGTHQGTHQGTHRGAGATTSIETDTSIDMDIGSSGDGGDDR